MDDDPQDYWHEGRHIRVQLQMRSCGLKRCERCYPPGQPPQRGHGPYWYGYWREGKQYKRKYFGKALPAT